MKVEKWAFAGRGLNVGQTGEGRDQRESVCHHPRPGTWSRILVQKGHHCLDREGRVKKLRGFRLGPIRAGGPALTLHEPPEVTAGVRPPQPAPHSDLRQAVPSLATDCPKDRPGKPGASYPRPGAGC